MTSLGLTKYLVSFLGVILAGSVVAGCSSGSSTSSTSSSAANVKTMSTVLLRSSDLPTGWESNGVKSSNDSTTRELAVKFPACKAYVAQADLEKSQLRASSQTYVDTSMSGSSQNDVSNSVVGYKTEDLAKSVYAVFASTDTETCLTKVFNEAMKQAAAQASKGGVTPTITSDVQRISVPAVGDASSAYEVVVNVSAASVSQQIGFVIQLVRVGPYVVSYDASLYAPVAQGFAQDLVDRSISRLQAAMGR
jgi:hypothetical protein